MKQSDFICLVDAAHDTAAPNDAWLHGLLTAVRPALDQGLGVIGWFHDVRGFPAVPTMVCLGAPPPAIERLADEAGQVDGDVLRAAMCRSPVATLRDAFDGGVLDNLLGAAEVDGMMADSLGLHCLDLDGHGIGLAAHSPLVVELSPRDRLRCQRVVAHLTAAFRLRRRCGATEAVVDSSGKIAHAEGVARSARAREVLRAAAIAHDRARMHGHDADEALDLRRALIAGRWTLVDTFERDGKRYLVARHNTPAPAPTPELSARETQVAVFAALGHPIKMISYELGLTQSSVATYLRRALFKLRLPDRLALAQRLNFLDHQRQSG